MDLSAPSDPSRPLQTPWNRNWPFGLVGGAVGGVWEALPYKGGLPQGSLVAQNLVDEGGYVAGVYFAVAVHVAEVGRV